LLAHAVSLDPMSSVPRDTDPPLPTLAPHVQRVARSAV
jgi:hypothetical protein